MSALIKLEAYSIGIDVDNDVKSTLYVRRISLYLCHLHGVVVPDCQSCIIAPALQLGNCGGISVTRASSDGMGKESSTALIKHANSLTLWGWLAVLSRATGISS